MLVEDIDWVGVAGDYTELYVHSRSYLLPETVNSLVQKLEPTEFVQIHRSRVVRTQCIVQLHTVDNREYLVKLSDGAQHRSSRTDADNLDRWLTHGKVQ